MANQPDQTDRLATLLADRKQTTSRLLCLLVVPVGAYYFFPSALVVWCGAAYAVGCFLYVWTRSRRIRALHAAITRENLVRLEALLRQAGYPANGMLGFGYHQTGTATTPVLLHADDKALHVVKNPLDKRCVYAVDNDFCYLFPPREEALRTLHSLPLSALSIARYIGSHRDFLLAHVDAAGRAEAVDVFVYDFALARALAGGSDLFINCAAELHKKRREAMYSVQVEGNGELVIPGDALVRLGIDA